MAKSISNLTSFFQQVAQPSVEPYLSFEPYLFKVNQKEYLSFINFCKQNKLQILDNIARQLEDVVRVKNPSLTDQTAKENAVNQLLEDKTALAENTNWVYFPWSHSVIHVLNEKDYFSVITNRNQYKITAEEQAILQKKVVGIVGLSVGGEAAVSIAQEHLCGTLKIADFDELDLSNLNRLNASIEEIGILKTTITARKIARINPYLQVEVFPEGIHENNMEDYLSGLDLLVEECDGLAIKYPLRQVAKAMKINTIYAADEKGLLSVEPYGNDPNYPIFHGKLKAPQLPRTAFDNDVDFMKTLSIWCGGWEHISNRTRQSLMDMGKNICGYPQLASEARFAAGQLGHVARKLLLGESIPAFFKHLDLETLIH